MHLAKEIYYLQQVQLKISPNTIHHAEMPSISAHIISYTADYGLFRVKEVFEHQISGNNLTGNESIAVTDSLLYIPSNENIYDRLIKVHTVKAPFDSLTAFLPRIIPPRMQPGAYNGYVFDVNNHGMAAVSYNGFPYIFLYNPEFKLQRVLYLTIPDKDKPDNPSAKPTKENAKTGVGVTSLITDLDFKDNGDLYFDVGSKFYRLATNNKEEKYELKNSWFFTFKDAQKRKANKLGINPTAITIADDKVYLGSIFKEHIYRFPLHK